MPPKPKVILYCVLSRYGGVETHVKNLAKILGDSGAEVTVAAKWAMSPDASTNFYQDYFHGIGVRLVTPRLNAWIMDSTLLPRRLQSFVATLVAEIYFRLKLKAAAFDLVSINAGGTFGSRLRRYAKPVGGKVVYHEHQTFSSAVNTHSQRIQMLQTMDTVSVNSSRDAAAASRLLGPAKRVVILPAIAAPMDAVRVPAKQTSTPFKVAFVGNLAAREKGAHKLLSIWKSHPMDGMQLTLHGPNADLLADARQTPGVHLAGPFQAKDLGQVFENVDLLVHPADDESLGLVLIEAMAHGVPFVATHVGGIIDIAHDNPHVATVANNEQAIYEGIVRMRSRMDSGLHNPVALQELYRERWSYASLAKRWLSEYRA